MNECAGGDCDTYIVDDYMTSRARDASLCQDSTLKCLQCGCTKGLCYVVLKKRSLFKKQKNGDRIRCPVHDNRTSYYTACFYDELMSVADSLNVCGVVWDWVDLPQDHHMHIDATVFTNTSHYRFEIDGEQHFSDGETARKHLDETKDEYLNECGAGVFRLHYRDKDSWGLHICAALKEPRQLVQYSSSYKSCLEGEHIEKHCALPCQKQIKKRARTR